ncbi:hypothetical protein GCM10020000_21390 [Streptomyces olivoverticillatus]
MDYISKPFDPWVLRAKVSVFVELYMKNCQLREQAALLRLQLESGQAGRSGLGEAQEPASLLAELSARLAAVEEQAEALSKQLDESADAAAVATAAHLERKLTGLRRALDALEPGGGQRGEPAAVPDLRPRQPPSRAGSRPALRLFDVASPLKHHSATRKGEHPGARVPPVSRR